MRVKNFSDDDFKQLNFKVVNGLNSESRIYYYGKYIVKMFDEFVNIDDKYNVLSYFDFCRKDIQMNLPEIVLAESLFYLNEKFCGYIMKNIYGSTLSNILSDESISFGYKRECLIKLGEFLEKLDNVRRSEFNLRSLFVNDLHAGNVIVTPDNTLRIIEVDSMSVNGDNNFSAYYLNQPYFSKMYKLKNKYDMDYYQIVANGESDLYCYIMIILEFITGKKLHCMKFANYEYYLRELRDLGLPIELFEIFMNVYSEEDNVNPYRLLRKLDRQILL